MVRLLLISLSDPVAIKRIWIPYLERARHASPWLRYRRKSWHAA